MIEDIFIPVELSHNDLKSHIDNFMKSDKVKSKATHHTYSIALEDFLKHCKRKKFRFLIDDVKKYRVSLEKRNMKTYTVSTYLTSLRRFCAYLVELKIIEKNPAKRVHFKIKNRSTKFDFLTKSQVKEVLESIDTSTTAGARDKALLTTILYCGCTEEEITLIMLADLQNNKKKFSIQIPPTKGRKGSDTVNIPSEFNSTFASIIKNRDMAFSNEPLFISYSNRTNNKELTTRGIREIILLRLRASGIEKNKKLTPFTLKHTSWIIFAKSNKNKDEVSRRLKIKSIATMNKVYKYIEEFDK